MTNTGYIKKEDRKKILFLGDDLRFFSGIATMSKEIVLGTAHIFNWVQIAGGMNHPDKGKRLDLSTDTDSILGIDNSSVILYPTDGYGNPDLIRQILQIEKPDAILIFTDPRYYTWLFDMEAEIRKTTPLIYLSIWDNFPAPLYNKSYYESCDTFMCISKQTKLITEMVLDSLAKEKIIEYVPHGINENIFKPITEYSPEYNDMITLKKSIFGDFDPEFVLLYNARNIRRKSTSDLIAAWSHFTDSIGKENAKKCALLLHTHKTDENGTDLPVVIELLCDPEYQKVYFADGAYSPDQMNLLYNIADGTALVSSNEGWGLSLTESMMAGKMIIANVTGGMQDQMRFVDNQGQWFTPSTELPSNHQGTLKDHGAWAIPVFPSNLSLVGSLPTPYIWDDRCDFRDISTAIHYLYNIGPEDRQRIGLSARKWVTGDESMMSARWMCKNVINTINKTIDNFEPRKKFQLIKIESIKPKRIKHKLTY